MRTYKTIVVDDELHIREAMELLLKQHCPDVEVCGMAASVREARKLIAADDIELIFLDIFMPVEDGFVLLEEIGATDYAIIFVTAHQEFALKALRANAIDYLLKPINALELQEAVNKAIAYLELRRSKQEVREVYQESITGLIDQISQPKSCVEKITVPEQFGFRIVKVCEIMYLEADSNYTILHFSGLNKIVATRSLGDFGKILDEPEFFRIHKSTIINMRFLQAYSSYQGNFAELTDGTRLIISRRRLNEFKEAVNHFSKLVE
jgi:two-component system LytT family response regulator